MEPPAAAGGCVCRADLRGHPRRQRLAGMGGARCGARGRRGRDGERCALADAACRRQPRSPGFRRRRRRQPAGDGWRRAGHDRQAPNSAGGAQEGDRAHPQPRHHRRPRQLVDLARHDWLDAQRRRVLPLSPALAETGAPCRPAREEPARRRVGRHPVAPFNKLDGSFGGVVLATISSGYLCISTNSSRSAATARWR
jgi:hypothetical protein